jgi:hypothetical protein
MLTTGSQSLNPDAFAVLPVSIPVFSETESANIAAWLFRLPAAQACYGCPCLRFIA